jgi:hypothetical protein
VEVSIHPFHRSHNLKEWRYVGHYVVATDLRSYMFNVFLRYFNIMLVLSNASKLDSSAEGLEAFRRCVLLKTSIDFLKTLASIFRQVADFPLSRCTVFFQCKR